ncbi:DUF4194 domain-containing protein [Microbacterium sp. zg.Y1090]|uniref:DUF4194 domain-containing protein n=1 Tax=Microbacterium TaxID=33882 RepID=UPI00214CD2E6|nr:MULTISPECIES: DUF4194 domain-containing protein [unclassified Microbacterium]MCR2813856.1 DUF4194 domain-containing protein [Microbacterium sp. zg.Y1084]MCR2819630.1 DUF4194 domain-containing protein [Microbacterium sp. zg.Y1090]MDL5487478.1 DUF4194 domain-containing protein [Microbacterium sp. zg-Y1211]WIM28124.1 DUF4194 domain-containing protein [Microbacterium sp. zg-Y1090]
MTDTAPVADTVVDAVADPATEEPFIAPVAMEHDPDELFPGDRGVLDPEARRVLVRLLQRRFLLADRNRGEWTVLMDHRHAIESRLNDLFVRLVVDHDRGVAYKEQVRSDELEVPILLRDEAYSRAETLVLVHLRTVYQRESTAGEPSARVDIEDIEQTVLTYFAEADGSTARRQKAIRAAVSRLRQDGIIEEESEGRYRISPLVEILLSSERLRELRDWLADRSQHSTAIDLDDAADDTDGADADGFAEAAR